MKFTTIAVVVRRVFNNPTVREVGRIVRRHLQEDVLQEAIEVVVRLVRGSSRAKAQAEREER